MERQDERRRRQPSQSRQTDRYDRERSARRSAGDSSASRSAQRTGRQPEYDTAQRSRRRSDYETPQRPRRQPEYDTAGRPRQQSGYETARQPRRQADYDVSRRSRQTSRYDTPRQRTNPSGYADGYGRTRRTGSGRYPRRRRKNWSNYILPALLLIAVFLMTVVVVFWPRTPEEITQPTQPTESTQTEAPTEEPTEAGTKPPPVTTVEELAQLEVPDYVEVWLIDVDGESRRGVELDAINDIVIHYVGNPGTEAWQNREYYAETTSDVSSHFVVGLEGEIIQCVPLNEKSSASNHRNGDTISIEVCHPDASGKFTQETYESLVKLTAWLVERLGKDVDNVIRHYDVTGKECPRYFVDNEVAWVQFKADVAAAIG